MYRLARYLFNSSAISLSLLIKLPSLYFKGSKVFLICFLLFTCAKYAFWFTLVDVILYSVSNLDFLINQSTFLNSFWELFLSLVMIVTSEFMCFISGLDYFSKVPTEPPWLFDPFSLLDAAFSVCHRFGFECEPLKLYICFSVFRYFYSFTL